LILGDGTGFIEGVQLGAEDGLLLGIEDGLEEGYRNTEDCYKAWSSLCAFYKEQ
jgi:hypothetical protein